MDNEGITKNCPECGAATGLKEVVCDCGHWFFRELEAQQSSELEEVKWRTRTDKLKNLTVFGGFAVLLIFVPAYWGGYLEMERNDPPEDAAQVLADTQPAAKNSIEQNQVLSDDVQYTVAAVLTGDMIVIHDSANRERRIRVFGIAAPKLDQDGGIESRENLAKLVTGKGLFIRQRGGDREGELVAEILKDGINIGPELLRVGMARLAENDVNELLPEQRAPYLSADSAARNSRLGLWASADESVAASPPVVSDPGPVAYGLRSGQAPRSISSARPEPAGNAVAPPEVVPQSAVPPPLQEATSNNVVVEKPAPATEPPPAVESKPVSSASPATSRAPKAYTLGPRGGCFYISASGNKTYVDRSLCN